MISASSSPSPRSGSRKSGIVVPLQPRDAIQYPVDVRQMEVLQVRRRVGDVKAGDPQDGCLEEVEALLGEAGDDLGAVAAEPRRFVDDDGAAGAAYRLTHGRVVKRRQRAKVDDLYVPALACGGFGGLETGLHRAAVADERDIRARPADHRPVDGRAVRGQGGGFLGPVTTLGLEEH